MKKPLIIVILGLFVGIGLLAGIKALQINKMIEHGKQMLPPPETVTAFQVHPQQWESRLNAVGSLSAVQGVTIAAEAPGKVVTIAFQAGDSVHVGDLLLRQDTSTEEALLPGAEAAVVLAAANLQRAHALLAEHAVSQETYDTALASHSQAVADAESLRAVIAKKNICAPFSGRLGIRLVNLGQMLKEGEAIVSLQSLDPIYADFTLPEQTLSLLQPGTDVRISTDAWRDQSFPGKINAINPEVDVSTRNIRAQAIVANPKELLRPGLFARVTIELPNRVQVLAVPSTAILYAPYGDSVFVIEDHKDPNTGHPSKKLRQQFVRVGEKRGDYAAIIAGLTGTETVVSTGPFKLRNGQAVVIDNSLAPVFSLEPHPPNN